MTYSSGTPGATITVRHYTDLRQLWQGLDPIARLLVESIHVERPLTAAQLRRLPRDLAAVVA